MQQEFMLNKIDISQLLTLQHRRCGVVVEGDLCHHVILLQLSDVIGHQNGLAHACVAH